MFNGFRLFSTDEGDHPVERAPLLQTHVSYRYVHSSPLSNKVKKENYLPSKQNYVSHLQVLQDVVFNVRILYPVVFIFVIETPKPCSRTYVMRKGRVKYILLASDVVDRLFSLINWIVSSDAYVYTINYF